MTRAWWGPSKWPCSLAVSPIVFYLTFSKQYTHKVSSLLPHFNFVWIGMIKTKKMHRLNSIVPLAYARFHILIILLLPHHHRCIASVYSISICRGGPFSTAEYGICWTPSLAPCSSMNKLLCSPHSSTTLLHLWGLLSAAMYGILLNSTSLARLLLHEPAIVLSTLQP